MSKQQRSGLIVLFIGCIIWFMPMPNGLTPQAWHLFAIFAATAPILYGADYVSMSDWWRLGFIITTVNVIIWLVIGGAWWKFIG